MPTIKLPPKQIGGVPVVVDDAQSIVIVGANGSGKTRMGAYIEVEAGIRAHRIGAQRALRCPTRIPLVNYQHACRVVHYGHDDPNANDEARILSLRRNHRWKTKPNTTILDDFQSLLSLLFAEERERNDLYAKNATTTLPTTLLPKSRLDQLREVWAELMPQRALAMDGGTVSAISQDGKPYEASELSDGERVAIYLLGHSLCAPENSVVIVDEPELHLHRAIQSKLWDRVEAIRSDCTFVYITHNVDFASSRRRARYLWVRGFDGTNWSWEEVETRCNLPEDLLFELLGSRQPVVFVEGNQQSSYDTKIYSALYPEERIIPCESCTKVVEATKSVLSHTDLHHIRARGIVDRDRRTKEEIIALESAGICVIGVAEVENLLAITDVLRVIATHLRKPESIVLEIEKAVVCELRRQLPQEALGRGLREIQSQLNRFGPKIGTSDVASLEEELRQFLGSIELGRKIKDLERTLYGVLESDNYFSALQWFNHKGILATVARNFKLTRDAYIELVIELLQEDPQGRIGHSIKAAIEST